MVLLLSPKHPVMGYPLQPAGGPPGLYHHPSMNRSSASRGKNRMVWPAVVAYMVTCLHQPGLSF
eukprot:7043406-Karenia_brevis.AAC.1